MAFGPAAVIAALALTLAGCASPSEPTFGGKPRSVVQADPGPREDNPSALDDLRDPSFPEPLIDPDDILDGGPPPDGIPPLDDPRFETAEDITWLDDTEPLLALTVKGETKGYPLRVMTWHEIVNDTVGGVPMAVTYCPLCNSGVAFERSAAGRLLSFGTSGKLFADNLVMYDRQTETLWPQLTGVASIGTLTGKKLTAVPMGTVGWDEFLSAHPKADVLSQDTGFDRRYGDNPYVGYDDPDGGLVFDLPDEVDSRIALKARVVGVSAGDDHVAIVRELLVGAKPAELTLGGADLVIWHQPGQRSALGKSDIASSDDIGTVGVFEATVDGRTLHFTRADGGFSDRETGTTWSVLGRGLSGPMKGVQLKQFTHLDTFWFSWFAFHPETDLIQRLPRS